MTAEDSKKSNIKEKVVHEFKEIALLSGYLAFFFCALATYSMLLLEKYEVSYFAYGAAIINALIITKVILIGEALRVGSRMEAKPLLISAVYKSFIFGLLVFAFHIVEEVVKRLIHGKDIAGTFHEVRIDDLLMRTVVIFCAFIPLFGFRELGRVLGPEKLRALLFKSTAAREATPIAK